MSPEAISRLLSVSYGLTTDDMTSLGGEADQNVAVRCKDGRRVVVKVAPPGADHRQLAWQHELVRQLSTAHDVPPVPQILSSIEGEDIVSTEVDGQPRLVRVQTWMPGRTLADLGRHSPELLREWGLAAAQLVRALPERPPPDLKHFTHHWDVLRAPQAIESVLSTLHDSERLRLVRQVLGWFDTAVEPLADELPRHVVHQDLNDFNVLAHPGEDGRHHLSGVLDFTDALYTARVSELAVAVAYAMLRKPEPLAAAAEVIRGFRAEIPLDDAELSVLYPMAVARLCLNAVTWTHRTQVNAGYAQARMKYTWPALELLVQRPPSLAEAWFKDGGLGLSTPPRAAQWAAVPRDLWSRQGHLAPALQEPVRRSDSSGGPATLSLGITVAGPDSRLVPLSGVIEGVPPELPATGDDTVVVRHDIPEHGPLWSRWRAPGLQADPGTMVVRGQPVAIRSAGTSHAEAVSVALFTDRDAAWLAPAKVTPSGAGAWGAISPDPTLFLGLAPSDHTVADDDDPVALRDAHLARSQRYYYSRPMRLVGSKGVWLHDDVGFAYLDTINNVSHVGHANSRVAEVAARQLRRLNTNSRFVYDEMGKYAARLAGTLPDPLEVVFLVCTGSEANDLALRIARAVTGREDVLVIEGAYHGSTAATIAASPNRYNGPGGAGRPASTHEVVQPNRYRGPFGYDDQDSGRKYAEDVATTVAELESTGHPPAAFIAESLMGTAGTIVHPDGYLSAAFEAVHAAGGLCISDEVQVGFGRLGSSFWAFEAQGVVPDIVTMGKPMGNGYPIAAVVTTREIADAFDTGMPFFNTFGGSPVACSVGMAVLDEIRDRRLQDSSLEVGGYLRDGLLELGRRHDLVGDVRGLGLYLGVEFVRDRETKEPATSETRYVVERLKEEGVISYPTSPAGNVLKIKPPLVFEREHATLFVEALDEVLGEDW